MAYTTINKSTDHFNTVTYSNAGDGAKAVTGVGFQPDLVWVKNRTLGYNAQFHDAVRGASNGALYTNTTAAVDTGYPFSSFDSDGFTTGAQGSNESQNSASQVAWNWKAGSTAPAITYTVKVVSDSGNKYRFDDFGTSAVTLDLQEGGTYTFDQSDSSNSGHPLRFYTASDKSGGEYTTGVTTSGTPGSSGAKTVITVAASAPTLYYQCSSHAGMGGQANTNSTFGSSNFAGGTQSTVSANTTAGFSIGTYTGTGSNATIGHGLGSTPSVIFVKKRNSAGDWNSFHNSLGNTGAMQLDHTGTFYTNSTIWNNTSPTSSVFSVGTWTYTNASSDTYVFYALAEKKGYSKFGSYTGNGNADGTFVYTGFRVGWVMIKRTDGANGWYIYDSTRDPENQNTKALLPAETDAEQDESGMDLLSNGFKLRNTDGSKNGSGNSYIYMAFAENPFVNSNGVPNNAT